MTEQEQAAADPRVGDRWKLESFSGESHLEVKTVNCTWISFSAMGAVSTYDRERFAKFVAGWTLAARGPAPEPKDDELVFVPNLGYMKLSQWKNGPATDGKKIGIADAWHADPDGWRRVGWNANISIDDSIIETLNQEWPTLGEFADAVDRDIELVNDTLTAVGRVAVFGAIWKFTEAGAKGNECPEAWKPGLRAAFLSELRTSPAKPERDPHTTPVVGDEWKSLNVRFPVVRVDEKNVVIQDERDCSRRLTYSRTSFASCSQHWELHRRGDDPSWRPEGERSEQSAFEWTKNKCAGRKAARVFSVETQSAAGIKVGDRVRDWQDDEGVVLRIEDDGAVVHYPELCSEVWYSFEEWEKYMTIIPPAAAPDQDEQSEPIEDIDRNPHTDPLVGDEWGDGREVNRVVALSDIQVCCIVVGSGAFFHYSRDDFADESMTWRFVKTGPDDTGVEPPTLPAYESIDHPPHYGGDSPHEVIKFIEAHDLGFNAGNVVKYVVRAGRKPGEDAVKDLEKAVWYLNRIVAAAKGTT